MAGSQIAGERLDLFLRAGHGQAYLLLRPCDVTVERVFLLLLFAPVQAPQNQTHDDQENQDRQERRQQIGIRPPWSMVPAGGRRRIRRRTGGARRASEKPFGQHAWHCSAAGPDQMTQKSTESTLIRRKLADVSADRKSNQVAPQQFSAL